MVTAPLGIDVLPVVPWMRSKPRFPVSNSETLDPAKIVAELIALFAALRKTESPTSSVVRTMEGTLIEPLLVWVMVPAAISERAALTIIWPETVSPAAELTLKAPAPMLLAPRLVATELVKPAPEPPSEGTWNVAVPLTALAALVRKMPPF